MDSDVDSISSFIDDEEQGNDIDFYCNFNNVETDIEQTLKNEYDEGVKDLQDFDIISNLCQRSEDEAEIYNFEKASEKIKAFTESLLPNIESENGTEQNNFIRVILYALRFDKTNKKDICDKNKLKTVIDEKLIDQLDKEKYDFVLDLQKFNNNCYEINSFLFKYGYFFRVFELKNKFRQLFMKEPKKQNIIRKISSCINEKYNGCQSASIEFTWKERKNFKPIDIIYIPTENPEFSSLCYFTEDISKAYTNFCNVKEKTKRAYSCYECFYCRKCFLKKDRHKRHIENCAGVPGVIYNFNTKSLISFEDNFHAKGDLPFVLYFDFETTAPTDNCFDPEQKKMFVVSYVIIVTFLLALSLDRIIIQRSYAHSIDQLMNFNYFSDDQMKFINLEIMRQLKDIAIDVSKRKCKITMGQMFRSKMP